MQLYSLFVSDPFLSNQLSHASTFFHTWADKKRRYQQQCLHSSHCMTKVCVVSVEKTSRGQWRLGRDVIYQVKAVIKMKDSTQVR